MPRAEREDGMLRAAGEVFARDGFHDASMDAIAQAAGISKPMLYNYFGSKQGLYSAYIERSGRALLQTMRAADSRGAPAAQRLHAGILAFLTYAEEHSAGWTILHRETLAQGGVVAAQLAGLRDRVTELLTTLFGDEAFAHAFAGAGESLAGWWLAHPEQPKERIASILMDIARPGAPAPRRHGETEGGPPALDRASRARRSSTSASRRAGE
jgi:AcrR family transcriptional regulator